MRSFFKSIKNSEFLTFNEVLKLKVVIINMFLMAFVLLTIPLDTVDEFGWSINIIIPIVFFGSVIFTFLLSLVNFNRVAMHLSILTIMGLTYYYITGTDYLFTYILFFVSLTIIIFYQDIITYLLYGGAVTLYGIYYITTNSSELVGVESVFGIGASSVTYIVIFVGFYIVFLVQFLLSDNIYEKLNNEWVMMNKKLERYQDFSHTHLVDMIEKSNTKPIYQNINFQKTIHEISVFINEFFEESGKDIAEAVEFYFFIHDADIEDVVSDDNLPTVTRKYAKEFEKYVLNKRSELVSILFDFATLFKGEDTYTEKRYVYNIEKLFENRLDKIMALVILYKYLKTEITQYDRFGHINRKLTHEEITDMFTSNEFREFIGFEQVNFFKDNEELFEKHL